MFLRLRRIRPNGRTTRLTIDRCGILFALTKLSTVGAREGKILIRRSALSQTYRVRTNVSIGNMENSIFQCHSQNEGECDFVVPLPSS